MAVTLFSPKDQSLIRCLYLESTLPTLCLVTDEKEKSTFSLSLWFTFCLLVNTYVLMQNSSGFHCLDPLHIGIGFFVYH